MTASELFDTLDTDADGYLSRSDLHQAASRQLWHWREAPLFAVLDSLTVGGPLSAKDFVACVRDIAQDSFGLYGQVLRRGHSSSPRDLPSAEALEVAGADGRLKTAGRDDHTELLRRISGGDVADEYEALLARLGQAHWAPESSQCAVLIIDPQRSFTAGVWKHSVGQDADVEVKPIDLAFANCARALQHLYGTVETMFTRCPFPPNSYDWDDRVAVVVAATQPYFVKPGNSALWPPTNGYQDWLDSLYERGIRSLVIGGCTLNSCVRVTAVETQLVMADRDFQVIVDLGLCGARASNYRRSTMFGGMSSVESAAREMESAGVEVLPRVSWELWP